MLQCVSAATERQKGFVLGFFSFSKINTHTSPCSTPREGALFSSFLTPLSLRWDRRRGERILLNTCTSQRVMSYRAMEVLLYFSGPLPDFFRNLARDSLACFSLPAHEFLFLLGRWCAEGLFCDFLSSPLVKILCFHCRGHQFDH